MCYSLKCIAILPDMMPRLDTRVWETLTTKHNHYRSYPNDAFDAAQYNSLDDMVLVDKTAMLLRLVHVHLNHPAAFAVNGMVYKVQRSYGSHTSILEADDVHKSGWHGTWVSALASWLSVKDISVKGDRGYHGDARATCVWLIHQGQLIWCVPETTQLRRTTLRY